MERYESLGLVGEGSYGTVLKCRHRDSGRLVAIKKFVDSDDDRTVKKIALREIKLLRQLRHSNLVNLLEVWKRRRRWYLVFEFVERSLLEDLERNPSGLDLDTSRQYLYQILRASAFCHQQNIIHRDIKPENILISQGGVVKLCDFGFARAVASPAEGAVYTDYVATRWYRAPELLVGDIKYGKPVDVWAIGCLLLEMLTGQPLFPGDSDLDQIHHIVRCFGNLTAHHQELFHRNPVFSGVRLPECFGRVPLQQRFPTITSTALDLAQNCLQMDPERRAQCSELLEHPLFTQDSFHTRFLKELNAKIQKDLRENSVFLKITKTQRHEGTEKSQRVKDKKQLEDIAEKVNEEKKDKREEDKMDKTKGKEPLKLSKSIHNTAEPLMSTKQSKIVGAKVINNTANAPVAMKSKPEKGPGAKFRKELQISKSAKTLDSPEVTRTITGLTNNNTVVAKPKHRKVTSPQPREDHFKSTMNTKDTDSSGLHSSGSDTTEKNVMDICRSSKSKQKQINRKNKVPKCSSITNQTNVSSSSKASLESKVNRTGSSLALQVCQPSCNDHTTLTAPSVTKPCKTTTTMEHQTNRLTTEQRRSSECPKLLTSNPKPSKTTSSSGPEMIKTNTSLSVNLSKTLTADRSAQPFKVFIDTSPAHTKTAPNPKLSKTALVSIDKPTNDTTCVPNKLSKGLQKDRELTEVSIKTKNQQEFNTSYEVIKDHGYLKIRPATETGTAENHIPVSQKDHKENPESSEHLSVHQQTTSKSKIIPESRPTSVSILSEIPETTAAVESTIPKTLTVSEKQNREDLTLSVSASATTESLVNKSSNVSGISSTKQKNNSSEVESGSAVKLASFSNHSTSPTTLTVKIQKTRFLTEARKTNGNPERTDTTDISTVTDTASISGLDSTPSTETPDHRASKRSFILHSVDSAYPNKVDFSVAHSSPPPPPPPPSSTPLLVLPSSTTLIPSFSVIKSPVTSDRLTLGAGFHPENHSLRCMDKPKHHGGVYSRLAQQSLSRHITASTTAQVSDKSLISDRSFRSDRCSFGNSGGVAAAKKKSDVHFPDLRSSALPELRGKHGKHNRSVSRDQRKDKQTVSPSEPQQHRHNSTDRHHTHTPKHTS